MSKKEEEFIINIPLSKPVSSQFIISDKQLKISQTGRKYLEFVISDKTGDIMGRYFPNDSIDEIYDSIILGEVYQVLGHVNEFPKNSGKFNFVINKLSTLSKEEYDINDFLRISKTNKNDLILKINETINNMQDNSLKNLLESFFNDKSFLENFSNAPAAKFHHHNYISGLLEHTVEVLELCEKTSAIFPELNKDLLFTGAILHDIGKIEVYDFKLGSILYSERGKLLDHIFISADMVKNKMNDISISEELADNLLHLILSHHGDVNLGWGSSVTPQTPEAIALHHSDNLDAKVKGILQNQL